MTTIDITKNIPPPPPPPCLTDDDSCMICYETLNHDSGRVTIKCGHKYCPGCFVKHMTIDNRCAMCRREIEMKKSTNIEKRTLLIRGNAMRFLGSDYITSWSKRLEESIWKQWELRNVDMRIILREEIENSLPEIINAVSENAIDMSRGESQSQSRSPSRFMRERYEHLSTLFWRCE